MRNAIKNVRQAEDAASAQTALGRAVSIIDKTVKKGILHRNTAARYKSRLTRQVQSLS
jgi:small subunit ribosomal protein S20